jgi:WD40 repeat protein
MRTLAACLLVALATFAADPPVTALAMTPDGKSVVSGSQAGVQVLTGPDFKPSRSLKTELSNVHDLAFSPDGKLLAVAGGSPGEKGMVELYRWPEGTLLYRVSPHKDVVHSVAWSSNSTQLASASADTNAVLIDAPTGKTIRVLEGHSRPVLAVEFLPGDEQIVTAGVDETLRLWDAGTGKPVRVLSNHTRPVNGLAVRPAREKSDVIELASISDDRTVRVWQPTRGRMVRFTRVPSEPRALAWTKDGAKLVVACKDGSVRTIDPDAAEVQATSPAVDGIAYSLAIAGDGAVLVGGRTGQLKRLAPGR